MSLNCNEIDLILSELDLSGSFLQEIVQPSFDSIALYTYKPGLPKTVFISLASGECRINQVNRKIPKNEKPLRFNEILRSKIKGGRIKEIFQINKERIIKLSIEKEGPIYVMPAAQQKLSGKKKKTEETENESIFNLYIRLWSNAGNIFLCDKDNIILDSFYRRPAKGEKTGEKLTLPEYKPAEKNEEILKKFPIRSFNELNSKSGFNVFSFNQKVDLFYSSNKARSSLESLLEQSDKWYNSHKSRLLSALERLTEKKNDFLNSAQWKHQGDLILSYGYLFAEGAVKNGFLECTDYDTGKTVSLKVDPKLTAQENATIYYETYKKQTGGLEDLEHDIHLTQKQIEQLDEKYASMQKETNPVKLEQILRKTQKPKQQQKEERPGLCYEVKQWTILVGRDANENDELLRHYVKGDDLWFHTRDYAGGYVFIKAKKNKTVPLEIMIIAGNLAVHYSKARKNGEADLYCTHVKYLRRAKNGPKGLVLPSNEKNLHIKSDSAVLRNLEENQF